MKDRRQVRAWRGSVRPLLLILMILFVASAAVCQPARPSIAEAQTLLQTGKLDDALDAFQAILKVDPGNAEAQKGEVTAGERLALEQRAAGKMPEALQALFRAEQSVPGSARLFYDQGILEEEMHLYPEAEKALDEAQQLHMEDPSLLYAMARVQLDRGQLAAAAEKMNAYLKLRPNDASGHYGLGRIDQMGMQFDQARAEFEESVRLQPVQTEAYYQLGDIALKQNRLEDALLEFNKTLERNPQHGGALAGAGEVCYKQKRYDQALDYLQKAVAAAPEYQTGHYYLGLTLARMGRKEDSARELAAAAKLADEENKKSSTRYQLVIPSTQ